MPASFLKAEPATRALVRMETPTIRQHDRMPRSNDDHCSTSQLSSRRTSRVWYVKSVTTNCAHDRLATFTPNTKKTIVKLFRSSYSSATCAKHQTKQTDTKFGLTFSPQPRKCAFQKSRSAHTSQMATPWALTWTTLGLSRNMFRKHSKAWR